MEVITCSVVGDESVGKTSLLTSYANNGFPQDHVKTIFDIYVVNVKVNGSVIQLNLCDTGGQDEFARHRQICYLVTNCILICFSVDNPASFARVLSKWHPEMSKESPNVPLLLIGNKVDLRENTDRLNQLQSENLEMITHEQGVNMAKAINATAYLECSALTQVGLKQVFDEAIKTGLAGNYEPEPKDNRCCVIL